MIFRIFLKPLVYSLASIVGVGGGSTVTYVEATRSNYKTAWRKTLNATGPVADCKENASYLWDFSVNENGKVELIRWKADQGSLSNQETTSCSGSSKKAISSVDVDSSCSKGFLTITCEIKLTPEGSDANQQNGRKKPIITYSALAL